jgi:3-phosphoshikimate 1-carboxyvinyltransferase
LKNAFATLCGPCQKQKCFLGVTSGKRAYSLGFPYATKPPYSANIPPCDAAVFVASPWRSAVEPVMSSSTSAAPQALWSRPQAALTGTIDVPGDKSISHRALMFGALAIGETTVEGLLEGEDVLRTAQAMRQLGATVERLGDGQWRLQGRGVGGLCEPDDVLDMGNAGTGARLLMGLLATHPFTSVLTGDGSLRKRPMARVTDPLSAFGATFTGRSGGRLPLAVTGTTAPVPQHYTLPMASAQVKSAMLLAGLNTPGLTTVIEPEPTRDHSELMLRAFGAELTVTDHPDGSREITLVGQPELKGQAVKVPGDPSSAAFPVVAALIVPGSVVTVRNVGMNPLRTGLFTTLREMGGDIRLINQRTEAGEPVADLEVHASTLHGVTVPAERAPSMIDEYPILAVAAACAVGETRMTGVGELRVKESDRFAAMVDGLRACGAETDADGDTLIVRGTGTPPKGGAMIPVELDHRIGMSYLVLGMTTAEPVGIDDAAAIATSFPGFADLMRSLGALITAAEEIA